MADAAKAARGSFRDIKSGASEMGGNVSYSMTEARHGVMLLGEEFGLHLPRGLTTFIASLGPVGGAMEAAFPFIAIAVGATLLLEHLSKLRAEGLKLTEDQEKFETAVNNAFNAMDEKILQAEKRSDELKGDHLGALRAELQLIDKQSLDELAAEFEKVSKAADRAFGDLQSHWYSLNIGSAGAKNALDQFQAQYELLLSKGDAAGASGLLTGTLAQAQKALDMTKQLRDNATGNSAGGHKDDAKYEEAYQYLNKINLISKATGEVTDAEVTAQQKLVGALQAQVELQGKIATLNSMDRGNAKLQAAKEEKKDTPNLGEAEQSGVNNMANIIRESNRLSEEATEEGWREQLNATNKGSAEKLAVIDAAIKDEEVRGMEATSAYRSLLAERVSVHAQMVAEDAKLNADAAREDADNTEKMAELKLAGEKQSMAAADSARRTTRQQQVAEDEKTANEDYAIKMAALEKEVSGLDKSGNDYLNRLKALQDKETQLTQQHENELTAIKEKATESRNATLKAAEDRYMDDLASGLTKSIMGQETWSRMLIGFGDQVVSSLMQNEIKRIETNLISKESDAASAARKAFNIGLGMGGPAGIVLGPVFAAAAFAGVMAFEGGTDRVPGIGRGDVVPAMLTPGEGVVPGGVMDGLRNVAHNGGFGQSPSMTVHVRPTYHVNTIDGDGMRGALEKHSAQLQQHFETAVRRMNK
jgi:hypothetical protein